MKRSKQSLWFLVALPLMGSGWGNPGLGCDGEPPPEAYEASVRGMWQLTYAPTVVHLSEAGMEGERGVIDRGPLEWKGSTVTLRCNDSTLLCPEEVLGSGDGRWAVEEMDPSELLFEVAVQPTQCTPAERTAAGGARCGDTLLPVERETTNIRLPADGSTLFMPRSEMDDLQRACYARTTIRMAFHDVVPPGQGTGRPQARRVTGEVTVTIDPACLRDDDGRGLARPGAEAELRMETAFSGTWSPLPE